MVFCLDLLLKGPLSYFDNTSHFACNFLVRVGDGSSFCAIQILGLRSDTAVQLVRTVVQRLTFCSLVSSSGRRRSISRLIRLAARIESVRRHRSSVYGLGIRT